WIRCALFSLTLFASRRRHTRFSRDWSSDVCSSDLGKMMVERLRHLTRYEYGHAAAFEYGQRFDARLAQITQPVSLIVIDDGTKGSAMGAGTFKYSPREMSEKVVGMLTSSKHAKVLPEDFTLADLSCEDAALAAAFRRIQDEQLSAHTLRVCPLPIPPPRRGGGICVDSAWCALARAGGGSLFIIGMACLPRLPRGGN